MFVLRTESIVKIDALQRCLDFLQDVDLPAAGSTVEIGNGIRCIVNQYETAHIEDVIWEAHLRYIDLHCIIQGEEQIGVAKTSICKTGNYFADKDYLEVSEVPEEEQISRILLKPGIALCLLPDDAHQVGVQAEGGKSLHVTKVVFKIPVELVKI